MPLVLPSEPLATLADLQALDTSSEPLTGEARWVLERGPLGYQALDRANNVLLGAGDDAGALLQACHDRIEAGCIEIGAGTFTGSPVRIAKSNVSLRGRNREGTVLTFPLAVGDATKNLKPHNVHLFDLCAQGGGLSFVGNSGGLYRVTARDCTGDGIRVDGLPTERAYNFKAVSCESKNNKGHQWWLGPNLSDSVFIECYAFRGNLGSVAGGDGWNVEAGVMTFQACHSYFNSGVGWRFLGTGQHGSLLGCKSESNGGAGVHSEAWFTEVQGGAYYNNGLAANGAKTGADLYLLNASFSRVAGGSGKFTGEPPAPYNLYVDGARDVLVGPFGASAATKAHVQVHNALRCGFTGLGLYPERATPADGALVFSGSSAANLVTGSILTHPAAAIRDLAAATAQKNRVVGCLLNGPMLGGGSVQVT